MRQNANALKTSSARELIRSISSLALALSALRLSAIGGSLLALWCTPLQALPAVAVYLAALNLVSIGTFGRFELLVLSASAARTYSHACYLCVATAAITILGTLLLVFFTPFGASFQSYTILFVVGLLARAWLRLGLVFSIRTGTQANATMAMLPHAVLQQGVLLVLLTSSCDPLVAFAVADISGHFVAAVCVCRNQWSAFQTAFASRLRPRDMWELASSNFELPTLNLSSTMAAAVFALIPVLFLAGLANSVLAGSMIMALKLLELPASLVSGSVTPVIMNRLASAKTGCDAVTPTSIFWLPLASAGVIFGIIAVGGFVIAHLDNFSEWHLVFALLPIAALFQAGVAGAAPLVEAAALAGHRSGMAGLNVASLALAAVALLVWGQNPALAIAIAGGLGILRAGTMSCLLSVKNRLPVGLYGQQDGVALTTES